MAQQWLDKMDEDKRKDSEVNEDRGDTEEEIGIEGADKLRRLYLFFGNRAHQQGGDAIRLVELWLEHRHMLGHIDSSSAPDTDNAPNTSV